MRTKQVEHCASCSVCGSDYKEPCKTAKGKNTQPHRSRRYDAGQYVAQAYCANEFYSTGYGCGTENCPHCS